MTGPGSEFSRRVTVRELPQTGRECRFEATEAERAAIARRLGILGVESLEARFSVTPEGRGALARGRFEAQIVQQCVVSLEPVTSRIAGEVVQRFAPDEGRARPEAEIEFDAFEAEEPPEPLIHGAAELGELVVEHLALAVDPYPRAAEAQADLPHEAAEAADTPFGKLRDLKISATEG
jgi:uncharacterized metal-binding protein YceD (DUF177 family)